MAKGTRDYADKTARKRSKKKKGRAVGLTFIFSTIGLIALFGGGLFYLYGLKNPAAKRAIVHAKHPVKTKKSHAQTAF